jgi:hypothetical protein
MARFYPNGYGSVESAIISIATARDPARWRSSAMLPGEQQAWRGLGVTYSAVALSSVIRENIDEASRHKTEWTHRCGDYAEAVLELRRALHSELLSAFFVDPSGALEKIIPSSWATNAGDEALWDGFTYIDYSPQGAWRALLLIKEAELAGFLRAYGSGATKSNSQNFGRPRGPKAGAVWDVVHDLFPKGRPKDRTMKEIMEIVRPRITGSIPEDTGLKKHIEFAFASMGKVSVTSECEILRSL